MQTQDSVERCTLQDAMLLDGGRLAELFPPSTHICQTICAGAAESALLLAGARHAGFQAGLFVAMPHKSTAKKYFLCMRKQGASTAHSALAGKPPLQQERHVCPASLADIRSASCLLGCIMVVPVFGAGSRILAVHVLPCAVSNPCPLTYVFETFHN